MTEREVWDALKDSGIVLGAKDGKLTAGPSERLTDELRAGIREHRDALIDEMASEILEGYRTDWEAIQPLYDGWTARRAWLAGLGETI